MTLGFARGRDPPLNPRPLHLLALPHFGTCTVCLATSSARVHRSTKTLNAAVSTVRLKSRLFVAFKIDHEKTFSDTLNCLLLILPLFFIIKRIIILCFYCECVCAQGCLCLFFFFFTTSSGLCGFNWIQAGKKCPVSTELHTLNPGQIQTYRRVSFESFVF